MPLYDAAHLNIMAANARGSVHQTRSFVQETIKSAGSPPTAKDAAELRRALRNLAMAEGNLVNACKILSARKQ